MSYSLSFNKSLGVSQGGSQGGSQGVSHMQAYRSQTQRVWDKKPVIHVIRTKTRVKQSVMNKTQTYGVMRQNVIDKWTRLID